MKLLVFAALSLGIAACGTRPDPTTADAVEAHIGSREFTLELALDDDARYQGLSDRESMPEDHGMLFVFPRDRSASFVMRRCHFPIDLLYLDAAGRVDSLHRMKTEPLDTPNDELTPYRSRWPVRFAIELNGGMIDATGIAVGDRVELPYDALKARAR